MADRKAKATTRRKVKPKPPTIQPRSLADAAPIVARVATWAGTRRDLVSILFVVCNAGPNDQTYLEVRLLLVIEATAFDLRDRFELDADPIWVQGVIEGHVFAARRHEEGDAT